MIYTNHSVKVYFNDTAIPVLTSSTTEAFPEGAYAAKAVLGSENASAKDTTRVYFMKKKKAGFDLANGDWSYATSNLKNGALVFDSPQVSVLWFYKLTNELEVFFRPEIIKFKTPISELQMALLEKHGFS